MSDVTGLVGVHIKADDTKQPIIPAPKKRHIAVFRAFAITATNPQQLLMGRAHHRVMAYIQCDTAIVIGGSASDVAGFGGANTSGPIVRILASTSQPPYPVDSTEEVWASMNPGAGATATVYVQEVFEIDA